MTSSTAGLGFESLLIHAAEAPDPITGAVAPNLVRSKTFAQKEFGGTHAPFEYSRGKSPTRSQLEEKLAILEGDPNSQATVFGSGVAAEAALFLTLSPGDHVLCCQEVYGGTFRLLNNVLSRFGLTHDFVNFGDRETICRSITPRTKFLFAETPTNPSLHIIDLALLGSISRETGIPLVVDSTFSPPCATRPFEYGATTIVHSLSKYIAGHNDILGGAVITKDAALHEKMTFHQRALGAVLSPDECYRILQEVKTLSLRWQRVSESAQVVAEFLAKSPKVSRVLYPGLKTHPNHEIAARQTRNGFGGILSFEVKAHSHAELTKFVDALRANGPIIYGESLASPETIIAYPPIMSHGSLPRDVRESLGISDGFFRLSLGFENPEDITRAFGEALATV